MKQQKEEWEEFLRSESLQSLWPKFGIIATETFDELEDESEKQSK